MRERFAFIVELVLYEKNVYDVNNFVNDLNITGVDLIESNIIKSNFD